MPNESTTDAVRVPEGSLSPFMPRKSRASVSTFGSDPEPTRVRTTSKPRNWFQVRFACLVASLSSYAQAGNPTYSYWVTVAGWVPVPSCSSTWVTGYLWKYSLIGSPVLSGGDHITG